MIRETFDCNMQDQLKLSFSPSYSYRNKIISRKISTMFALGMRRSKLFPHDNLCCSDIKENQHKLIIYSDSGSKFEFEIDLVANHLYFD